MLRESRGKVKKMILMALCFIYFSVTEYNGYNVHMVMQDKVCNTKMAHHICNTKMAHQDKRVLITNLDDDENESNCTGKRNKENGISRKMKGCMEKKELILDQNGNIGLEEGDDEGHMEDLKGSPNAVTADTSMKMNYIKSSIENDLSADCLYEYDQKADEDYDTDLEYDEGIVKSYVEEQKEKYINRCRKLGIPPVTIVLNGLTKSTLRLSHQGLGSTGLKAIVPTLKSNTCITELDLRDNNIDEEGIRLIARTLTENFYINDLDISLNNINNAGLEELVTTLKTSKCIKHLKMSQTGLKDRHASMISDLIRENEVIMTLSLNGNEFGAAGGSLIGNALTINNKISHLDLSWNHIRYEGATAIGQSLKLNSSLTTVNLAWNGFADNGAEAIAKALPTNDSLQELDLSYNRISDKGSTALADSLRVNKVIKVLKMNWNAVRSDGVSALINGIDKNDNSKIGELHLNGVIINGVCKAEMDALLLKRLQLQIYVGGVTNSSAMATNMNKIRREIVEIITTYLSKNRLRMLDLFNQWDKDKSLTLTRNEFRKGIKSCKIPISEIQLYFMLEWLDQDGNDEIEYNEFVAITEVE